MSTHHVDLPAGRIRYEEAGEGPPIVFVHGVLVNGRLWRNVTPRLSDRFRCIVPDLPLGAHSIPLNDDADRTPAGAARLVGDFLAALDLEDVTLVANDTGGALTQMLVTESPERVGRVVLTPCDAFDNFLPPMFKPLQLSARFQPALTGTVQLLRIRPLRRLPIAFGWLTKRPIPNEVTDEWVRAFLARREVRRDAARLLASIDTRYTLEAAEKLGSFDRPVLLAWATEDRVFPVEHAHRLAKLFPNARVEEIPDSYSFVPEDQPERLAALVREFAAEGANQAGGATQADAEVSPAAPAAG
ncbi:MAG TPA: alpha/beta hydrolase [Thermoleophilaceae bacterium]|jgi:pimeloyl-ACP methyl ester carboxylesterase